MTKWLVELTPIAAEQFAKIKDKRIQRILGNTISKLEENPEQQGKPLRDDLAGYRSVRSVGQRYRVIYKVVEEEVIVTVVGMGIRKEGDKGGIYVQLQKLLKQGLLEPLKKKPEEK